MSETQESLGLCISGLGNQELCPGALASPLHGVLEFSLQPPLWAGRAGASQQLLALRDPSGFWHALSRPADSTGASLIRDWDPRPPRCQPCHLHMASCLLFCASPHTKSPGAVAAAQLLEWGKWTVVKRFAEGQGGGRSHPGDGSWSPGILAGPQ